MVLSPGVRAAAGHQPPHDGCHHSKGVAWPLQCDEAKIVVDLIRFDDYDGLGNNVAPTQLRVTLQDSAFEGAGGSTPTAQLWVTSEDARMLAAILTRFADRADRANGVRRWDLPASEGPERV